MRNAFTPTKPDGPKTWWEANSNASISHESAKTPSVNRVRPLTRWTQISGDLAGKAASMKAKATAKPIANQQKTVRADGFSISGRGEEPPLINYAFSTAPL
jgi:hypothetical protein